MKKLIIATTLIALSTASAFAGEIKNAKDGKVEVIAPITQALGYTYSQPLTGATKAAVAQQPVETTKVQTASAR